MRFELIPVLVGIVLGVVALALIADALIEDGTFVDTERRRRERPERSRPGELCLGLAVLLIAVAFISPDNWRYTTVAMIGALVLFGAGMALNWKYIRGLTLGPVFGRFLRRRTTDRVE
jgi:hypothetical protein